jgi:hypothetical protein
MYGPRNKAGSFILICSKPYFLGNRRYLKTNHCYEYTNTSVLSHSLHQCSGNGFQRQLFLFLWVPELSLCPSHNNSWLTLNNYYSHNHTCSSLYSFGIDCTENAASDSSSIVACICCLVRLQYCCVFMKLLPSNGCCVIACFVIAA